MSKIPQDQWGIIVLRYSQGETLASIARSYACTAPAIHYILKRNKAGTIASKAAEAPRQMPVRRETVALRRTLSDAEADQSSNPRTPSGESLLLGKTRNPLRGAPTAPQKVEEGSVAATRRPGGVGRAAGLTATLDSELRAQAEAGIEAFLEAFDEALADPSPATRGRLRQAASDLMRVAARTTLVLDRLNADPRPVSIELRPRSSSAQQKMESAA